MIYKGRVSAILDGGKKVTVTPYAGETVTFPLVVPFFLIGAVPVNTPVVYATFADNSGIIIARTDGEWNHEIAGDITILGNVTAENFISSVADFNSHTHNSPDGTTSGPT